MSDVILSGINEKIFFKAPNYYGANIKVGVFDDNTGEYIVESVPMTEIIEPVADVTVTTDGEFAKGDKVITVDNADDLYKSNRVEIDGEVYRIVDIDKTEKTITLHKGLIEDSENGNDVELVGNMAIYRIMLLVTRPGIFIIQAKSLKYGLQYSDSITVKEDSLEDMFKTTTAEINENERIIKETSGFQIII